MPPKLTQLLQDFTYLDFTALETKFVMTEIEYSVLSAVSSSASLRMSCS